MTRARLVIAPVGDDVAARREVVRAAERRGFHRFLLPVPDPAPSSTEKEVYRDHRDRWEREAGEGPTRIPVVEVADLAALGTLSATTAPGSAVGVRWVSDRVIPLESVVAALRGRAAIWAVARNVAEVPSAMGALEHGADHVVVELRHPDDVSRLAEELERSQVPPLAWETVAVRRVEPSGTGDRVIVDTTSMLRPAEGLLVGSSAAFLFHVASEAVGSRFSRPRPFRVNAGAAHSYVLLSDGTTRYLSELTAGDAVVVAEPNGASRSVRVGRLKVERRPLLLIEGERGDHRPTVFLQEAETVRVSLESGPQLAVTELATGARLYGVALPPARHLGRVIEETIEER